MAENPDEPDIVQGLQRGDPHAWEMLCKTYSVRLWRYVARMIGPDEATVADVFQETMLAVAKSGRSLRSDSRIWAWLATIAHNQCALHWRLQKRRPQTTNADVAEIVVDSAEDLLARDESIATVRSVLAELPADYALLLTAKYSEKQSASQIAASLGESTEAIRSRLARARREFRHRHERIMATTSEADATHIHSGISPIKSTGAGT